MGNNSSAKISVIESVDISNINLLMKHGETFMNMMVDQKIEFERPEAAVPAVENFTSQAKVLMAYTRDQQPVTAVLLDAEDEALQTMYLSAPQCVQLFSIIQQDNPAQHAKALIVLFRFMALRLRGHPAKDDEKTQDQHIQRMQAVTALSAFYDLSITQFMDGIRDIYVLAKRAERNGLLKTAPCRECKTV